MKILIADDEPLARTRIARLLEKVPDAEVVLQVGNGRDTLHAIQSLEPELVFLDIQMPDMTGMEVIAAMDLDEAPMIIFVTAYDRYALQAFDYCALDYLLKPYEDRRFHQALARARQAIADRDFRPFRKTLRSWLDRGGPQPSPPKQALQRLTVHTGQGLIFVPVAEIDWLEAEGVYVRVHAGKRQHLMRDSMRRLEAALPIEAFVRIHRSTMVNLKVVKAFKSLPRGDGEVTLLDGTCLRLSRNYRAAFQTRLGI